MAKRDQLRRLLEIDSRIRGNTYPTADDLAHDLEVSRRVIFQDRTYLINLGAPLGFDRKRRGWYYTQPNWIMPTGTVTRGEIMALLMGVEVAQRQLEPGLATEVAVALESLRHKFRTQVQVDFNSLRAHLSYATPPVARINEEYFLLLREAIDQHRVVAMTYFTASTGQKLHRKVEPYLLHNSNGDWYLLAYDQTRAALRTFNLARITSLQLCDHFFEPTLETAVHERIKDAFRAETASAPFCVQIRFDHTQAPYIRERQWHPSQKIRELEDGGLIVTFSATGLGELKRWVMQYGASAEVLEPEELRESVRQCAESMMRLYAPNP